MTIITRESQLERHVTPRKGGKASIKYIVIHDTGNTAPLAGAITHQKYFHTTNRKASADFVVDDTNVIKLNDYTKYFTWHAGDGKGKYGIKNSNSVGIELCVDKGGDLTKTYQHAYYLIINLMKELQVPIERVVRHYDASRKICPNHMSANNWKAWYDFKDNLKHMLTNPHVPQIEKSNNVVDINYKGMLIKNVECILKDDCHYIKVRDFYENKLHQKVNWQNNIIYISD